MYIHVGVETLSIILGENQKLLTAESINAIRTPDKQDTFACIVCVDILQLGHSLITTLSFAPKMS